MKETAAHADGGGGRRRCAISCFALACELATRFLDDYITGRQVLQDQVSPQHNLVRTRCQIALAKDMQQKDERHERHRAGLLDEVQGRVKIQAGG